MATRGNFPSPLERRQRNRREVAQAILDAAREVMREDGVAALNLNEVARRLGMTTPALYKYFPGKAAIYDELFKLAHQTFLLYVSRFVEPEAGFWDAWSGVLRAQLAFAHDHPDLFALGFERPVPGFVPSQESMAISQSSADQGEALIRRGMETGEITSELSLAQVRDLLFAVTGGLTSAQMANEPAVPPEHGRFGSLAEPLTAALRAAWGNSA